jgi:mRNA interferase MazF
MEKKDFTDWMRIKSYIHNNGSQNRLGYKEGDVLWCSIGANVGFEEDGKHRLYNRPVLVLRGFSREIFFGIPLSTTARRGKYYFEFTLSGKTSVALLSQARVLDIARCVNGKRKAKIGRVDRATLEKIRHAFIKVIE